MTPERLAEIEAGCQPAGWFDGPAPGEGNIFYKRDIRDLCKAFRAEQEKSAVLEAALKECYSCIEDGKPSHALDVIDKLFPHTDPRRREKETP